MIKCMAYIPYLYNKLCLKPYITEKNHLYSSAENPIQLKQKSDLRFLLQVNLLALITISETSCRVNQNGYTFDKK